MTWHVPSLRGRNPQATARYWAKNNTKLFVPKYHCLLAKTILQDCSSFEGDKCCGKQVIGVFNFERKYYIHFKSKNEGKDDIKLKKKTLNQTASPYVD